MIEDVDEAAVIILIMATEIACALAFVFLMIGL